MNSISCASNNINNLSQEKHKELLSCFDELEFLFKTTQLVLLDFKTSILNEYRYCARALVDYQKAEGEKERLEAIARAEVAISSAYNDIIDYILDAIKIGVATVYSKYWDRPIKDVLTKYGYPEVQKSITAADELVIETRRDRSNRLSKYIEFSKTEHFNKLSQFALNFSAMHFELETNGQSGKQRSESLVHKMAQTLNTDGQLDSSHFELYFQPKFYYPISAQEPVLIGAEALIRFVIVDEKKNILAPDQFLKVAHKAGLTTQIESWVLNSAISIGKKWIAKGLDPKSFDLSINISPVQLSTVGFAAHFRENVVSNNVDELISIELLEEWDRNDGIHMAVVSQLNELDSKTKVHIDDFGTGTTKLAYISHTNHLDSLKIDRGIISGLETKGKESALNLIKGILAFASQNSLSVIAEGVEKDAQLETLRQEGIEYFQGFHHKFSKPLPISEFENLFLNKLLK